MAVLSKFAQKIAKDGYVARFNSLKNVPVFYEEKYDSKVDKMLNSPNIEVEENGELYPLFKELEKNKVIVPNLEYDDIILKTIVSQIEKPYPSVLYMMLTEKCNFACDYCFIERHMKQNKTSVMTKEIAKKGIDFFVNQIKLQPEKFDLEKTIIFYGGEPLSNFEVLEYAANLINQYKEDGLLPSKTILTMVTNGSFITKELAKKLNNLNISFSISLDGATKVANSCRRYHNGKEAYDDIIKGLNVAKEEGCAVSLSVTLSEEALKEGDYIFELVDKYQMSTIGFNILMTDSAYSVPEQYFIDVSNFIVNAFKVFREKGIFEDRVMRKVEAFVKHRLHYQDCAAEGGNQLVIAPDGAVGLCHGYLSTRETFITNVDDVGFDVSKNDTFLEWNQRTPLTMPQCEKCMALGICGGGCALNAKANGKSIWDLDERFCIHSKTTLEFLIWDLLDSIKKQDK